jgi:hypothetical protein
MGSNTFRATTPKLFCGFPILEQYLVELANPMIYELISEELVQKILNDPDSHSGS